jgi:hypothetical protein
VSRSALGSTQPPIQCVQGSPSTGAKLSEYETDHSRLFSAVVKNVERI